MTTLRASACIFVLLSGTASAAFMDIPQTPRERCEPVEYAELKDMGQADLAKAYCDTEHLAADRAAEATFAAQMAKIDLSFARRDAFERWAAQCKEQSTRVGEIYARRFGKIPACETPAEKP